MSLLRKLFTEGRLRARRERLAREPSPMSYAALAEEHARLGQAPTALQVCEEGLRAFPGSAELARRADRARAMLRAERMSALKRELLAAPRPALWSEMGELLLELGQSAKAEECALHWLRASGDGEAQLFLARVRVERFLADRGRELGRQAFEALEEAQRRLPGDERPWLSRLSLSTRIGALGEARRSAAALLELRPGDPSLEGRYRALLAAGEVGPGLGQALREVERSGRLADEPAEASANGSRARDLRPALQRLAAQPGSLAALYVRGGTALVQGQKGATAERTARGTRMVLHSARSCARRLGLGQLSAVSLEGSFGSLSVEAGEMDAGALWCSGRPGALQEAALLDLAGSDADIIGSSA